MVLAGSVVGDSPGFIRRTEKFGLEHVKGRTVGQTIFIELRDKYSLRACRPIHSRFFGRPLFYGIERSRIYPLPSPFLSSIFLIPAVALVLVVDHRISPLDRWRVGLSIL